MTAPELPPRLAVTPRRGFVGRAAELELLRAAVTDAIAGAGPRAVLVSGEPGAGKTTLLAAVAGDAHRRRCAVRYGRAEEGLDVPYGLWRQLLGVSWPTGASDRGELFTTVLDSMAALAASRPLVLALDDLQWADPDSLVLLVHLVGARVDPHLVLLIAYRSTEVATEGVGGVLAAINREPDVTRVELGGLTTADIEMLADAARQHEPSDRRELAARVCGTTGGNAFFVTAVLDELERTGAMDPTPSSTLRDAIRHRVDRLGDDAARVLRAAAVVGDTFSVDLIEAVTGLDRTTVVDGLDRATRDGLVVAIAGSGLDFAHALVADALLAELSPARRQELHRVTGEILQSRGGDAAVVARHLAAAAPAERRGRELAADAAITAGIAAVHALAYDDAAARFEEALDMVRRWTLDDDRHCTALLGLARARRRAGKSDAAVEPARAGIDLAMRLGRWNEAAEALVEFPLLPSAIPDSTLVEVLERAAAAAPDDALTARTAARFLLSWTVRYADFGRAVAAADEAATLAAQIDDPVVRSLAGSALALAHAGDPDAAGQLALIDSVDPCGWVADRGGHRVRPARAARVPADAARRSPAGRRGDRPLRAARPTAPTRRDGVATPSVAGGPRHPRRAVR